MTIEKLAGPPKNLSWSPLEAQGGANFCSHKIKITVDKAKVVKTIRYKAFVSFFYGISFWALFIGVPFNIKNASILGVVFMLLLGGLFLGCSYLLFGAHKHYSFDLSRGIYFYRTDFDWLNPSSIKKVNSIDQIIGLQILREWIVGNSSGTSRTSSKSYYSYEINVVLKDLKRIHIMDHANLESIESGATQFAELLGVPLWKQDFSE